MINSLGNNSAVVCFGPGRAARVFFTVSSCILSAQRSRLYRSAHSITTISLVKLKHKLCPLCVAAFVTAVCVLWEQLSPIVSGFPSGAPEVGLADQCGRCARANFSGCWFSMGSKFCCCSTTIKPLRNRAALPASSFTRSCSCIIEVTVLKAASRSFLFIIVHVSRVLKGRLVCKGTV